MVSDGHVAGIGKWDWLGPAPLSSNARKLLMESNLHKQDYFRRLSNGTVQFWHGPLRAVKKSAANSTIRVLFIGDSVSREMSMACSAGMICSYVPYDRLCASLEYLSTCAPLNGVLREAAANYSVLWLGDGAHHLLRDEKTDNHSGLLGATEKAQQWMKGRGPAHARTQAFSRVLEMAANLTKISSVRVVVSTTQAPDEDLLYSEPANRHALNMYGHLGHIWSKIEMRMGETLRPEDGVLVAPVHEVARRYQGLRCDGMHYGSFISRGTTPRHTRSYDFPFHAYPKPKTTDDCHPKLCVYHALIGMATQAVLTHVTLAKQVKLFQQAGRLPTYLANASVLWC